MTWVMSIMSYVNDMSYVNNELCKLYELCKSNDYFYESLKIKLVFPNIYQNEFETSKI